MKMDIDFELKFDRLKHILAIQDDSFWKYSANEWWKLISKYTPKVTGTLIEDVDIKPKVIGYNSPSAHYLYKGELMVDPETRSSWARSGVKKVYAGKELVFSKEKNGLASKEWDKAAEPTEKPKLIQAMQKYVDSGRIKL